MPKACESFSRFPHFPHLLCYKSKVLEAAKCLVNWAEATSVLETSAPPSLISFIYLFILFIVDWNHNLTYVKRMLHHRVSLLLPTILSYIPLFSFVCLLKTVSLAAQPVLRSQDPWFCCTSIGYHQTWHWLPSLFLVLSLLLPCLEVRICWYIPQASLQLAPSVSAFEIRLCTMFTMQLHATTFRWTTRLVFGLFYFQFFLYVNLC